MEFNPETAGSLEIFAGLIQEVPAEDKNNPYGFVKSSRMHGDFFLEIQDSYQ